MSISCGSENEVKELLDRVKKMEQEKGFIWKGQSGNEVTWNIAKENR